MFSNRSNLNARLDVYRSQCCTGRASFFGAVNGLVGGGLPRVAQVYCVDRMVPDSACSGTAIQCGVKTNYYTLGVSANVQMGNCSQSSNARYHLKCLYDLAQEAGGWLARDARALD